MKITPHTSLRKPAYPVLLATVAAGVLLAPAAAQEKQVIRGRREPVKQLEVPVLPGVTKRKPVDDAKPQPKPTPGATPVSPEKRQEGQRTLGKMRAREPKSPQKP